MGIAEKLLRLIVSDGSNLTLLPSSTLAPTPRLLAIKLGNAKKLEMPRCQGGAPPEAFIPAYIPLILRMFLSLRTVWFESKGGTYPRGRTLALQRGHKEEFEERWGSIHSAWKMCKQGSSRTMEAPGSNSSRHTAQPVWEKAWCGWGAVGLGTGGGA